MPTLPPLFCVCLQVAGAGCAARRGFIVDKTICLVPVCQLHASLTSPVPLQGETTCVVLWAAAKTNASPTWSWSCRWDLSSPPDVLFAAETEISAAHSNRHTSFVPQGEEPGGLTQNHDWRHLLRLNHSATRQADFRGHRKHPFRRLPAPRY